MIAATAVGAAAIGATLGLFFAANTRLKSANTDSARAAKVSAAAFELRSKVVELGEAVRGVVASTDRASLTRWRRAELAWPPAAAALERAAATSEAQRRRTAALRFEIRLYVKDYGEPLVRIWELSPAAARSSDANTEGATRLQLILDHTDDVAHAAAVEAGERSANASRLAHQATVAGIVALVLTPVLLVLLGLWLARVVADPLRRTVAAASEVAAGNFDVRLNDRRRDEFGELAQAFNAMTQSLATSRSELIERAESLEQSERHKSELISMVSHEVRTPLASVLGFTRLLLERDLPEDDRQRYLEIIDAEATRLAALVSDFLDARLIEEGRFSLRREPFDLRSLVIEQAEVALGHDQSHRHELQLDLPDEPDAPTIALSPMNFGAYPRVDGRARLSARFHDEREPLAAVRAVETAKLCARDAERLGLVTVALDDIDWDDELRLVLEERASMSPDALTGMEANLRFGGAETMETRVFGRLSAWQNWIFVRPNAVGEAGALKVFGTGAKARFDWERV